MPRITVTGVRSSCPSREISSWRRAARSSRASCAISSWRVRRRSRSSASVSSSITVGVTSGESTPPPVTAWRTACRISSPSLSFSTYPDAPATSISRTARWSSEPVRATMPSDGKRIFSARVASMPSISGIRTSISTTSGSRPSIISSARTPLGAWPTTVISSVSSSIASDSRKPSLSSTSSTRTRGMVGGRVATFAGKATSVIPEVSARTTYGAIQRIAGSLRGTPARLPGP